MQPVRRLTGATSDVLRVLLAADAPVWGLRVITDSGRPAGTVYPLLERLEAGAWLRSEWEDAPDRRGPRRRLYTLTPDGRAEATRLLDAASSRARAASPSRLRPGTAGA